MSYFKFFCERFYPLYVLISKVCWTCLSGLCSLAFETITLQWKDIINYVCYRYLMSNNLFITFLIQKHNIYYPRNHLFSVMFILIFECFKWPVGLRWMWPEVFYNTLLFSNLDLYYRYWPFYIHILSFNGCDSLDTWKCVANISILLTKSTSWCWN